MRTIRCWIITYNIISIRCLLSPYFSSISYKRGYFLIYKNIPLFIKQIPLTFLAKPYYIAIVKRNLKGNYDYDKLLGIFENILSQRRNSRKKIYSIHEPEVQCICNGKEHKKYEFGNKVSIIRSVTGIILGAMSFRNGYDGHTIGSSWEQVEWLTGRKIKVLAGDRGYRGKKEINGTKIIREFWIK